MKKGDFCPLLKKDCIENKCAWYQQVRGEDPQTGQPVAEWQCVVNLIPLLLIENSHRQHSTAAAIESFRNESVRQNNTMTEIMAHSVNQMTALASIQPAEVKLLGRQEDG